MRHTKIIATVGPACDTDTMLDALIAAGTDIFRLNFSHGTHESQAASFARVRAAAARAGREVAILQDLGGPKIRTGAARRRPRAARSSRATRCASRRATSSAARAGCPRPSPASRAACTPAIACCWPTAASSCASRRPTARRFRRRSSTGGELGEHKGINAPGVRAADLGRHAEGRRRPRVRPRRSASTWWRSASCRPPPISAARAS